MGSRPVRNDHDRELVTFQFAGVVGNILGVNGTAQGLFLVRLGYNF